MPAGGVWISAEVQVFCAGLSHGVIVALPALPAKDATAIWLCATGHVALVICMIVATLECHNGAQEILVIVIEQAIVIVWNSKCIHVVPQSLTLLFGPGVGALVVGD